MVWAVPCDCTTGDRTERALAKARVPERYRHCDFENYETDNEIENVARRAARRLEPQPRAGEADRAAIRARNFLRFANASEHGLLLMGPCGVGKTHLAVSALKEIVLRGHSGLFYDYRELLKEIQDSYNAESQATEMSVLEPVLKAEILVLDDVGSSKPSPWALETVGHVLNTRYNEKRVTLLTTNFLDPEASARIPSGLRSRRAWPGCARLPSRIRLTERVGKRIRSRLYEMCRTVEISAPDYRKEIRHAGRFVKRKSIAAAVVFGSDHNFPLIIA